MDELAKEGLKAVVSVTLRPLVRVIEDGIGAMGGDRLEEFRLERKERRSQRRQQLGNATTKLLQARNVENVAEPTETSVEEILGAAQDENREELQRLWASLLAAALDPARARYFRHEFINVAKGLEPVDALVLPILADGAQFEPTRYEFLANRLKRAPDEILLSFRNLRRLGLIPSALVSDS